LFGAPGCTPARPLRSAGSIVTLPAKGAKNQNLPMHPKRSLALRRYARLGTGPRTLTRSRLALHITPSLKPGRRGSCDPPGRVPTRLLCAPRSKIVSETLDFSFVGEPLSCENASSEATVSSCRIATLRPQCSATAVSVLRTAPQDVHPRDAYAQPDRSSSSRLREQRTKTSRCIRRGAWLFGATFVLALVQEP